MKIYKFFFQPFTNRVEILVFGNIFLILMTSRVEVLLSNAYFAANSLTSIYEALAGFLRCYKSKKQSVDIKLISAWFLKNYVFILVNSILLFG